MVQGQSASSSGAITTPLAIALVITNILTGQIISRVGLLKPPMVAGAIISVIGVGLLTLLNVSSQPWHITLIMVVIGIGLGLIMPITTIAVQESVARRDLGSGISSTQFFRSIGSTIGVAIIGTVVTNSYISNINAAPGIASLPAALHTAVQEPQNLLNPQVAASLPASVIGSVHQALSTAVNGGFFIALGVSVIALVATLLVPSIRIKTGIRTKTTQANLEDGVPAPAPVMTSPSAE